MDYQHTFHVEMPVPYGEVGVLQKTQDVMKYWKIPADRLSATQSSVHFNKNHQYR